MKGQVQYRYTYYTKYMQLILFQDFVSTWRNALETLIKPSFIETTINFFFIIVPLLYEFYDSWAHYAKSNEFDHTISAKKIYSFWYLVLLLLL